MIKVDVIKSGIVTNSAQFETQVEVDAWISQNTLVKAFGKSERWVHEKDLAVLGEDKTHAIEFQESGEPESLEKIYKFSADYTISQSDITVEIEHEKKIQSRLSKQGVGALVIAIATEINDSKSFTQEQLQAFLADQALVMIERLAWSGSLDLLAASIQAYSGAFYDTNDKVKMLAPITAYLSSQS